MIALLLSATALASSTGRSALAESDVVPTDAKQYREHVAPFLSAFCLDCHTGEEAEAEFRLDDIDPVITMGQDIERWEKVLEMISIADMPPEEADQPAKVVRKQISGWVKAELQKIGRGPDDERLNQPEFGNRVDHDELFSGEHKGPAYSPPRIWRKSSQIYRQFENVHRLGQGSDPFPGNGGHGFQDYALLKANTGTITSLQINAANYVAEIIDGRMTHPKALDGKPDKSRMVREGKSSYGEFNALVHEEAEMTDELLTEVVKRSAELMLDQELLRDEVDRYRNFLREAIEVGGRKRGLESLLTAIILKPEFLYRQELGLGRELPDGRRMLSPEEIAFALAYALTDSPPDDELRKAVEAGKLSTKEDVEREVRRMLEIDLREYWPYEINHTFQSHYDQCPNPRILRFFREFFGYEKVFDVFKDEERNRDHKPQFIFKDADLFVLSVLERDHQVLAELLTSNQYVVHYANPQNAKRRLEDIENNPDKNNADVVKLAKGLTPVLGGYRGGNYFRVYGFERETWDYPIEQPFEVEHRAGMLTHPAWLVAHSGNFDTDPIRRGKWIRERLLADVIPEIPIGVDASLEVDSHKTMREKLAKTETAECWRCHKKMNPLGLPFEQFDDFGRYREHVYADQNGELTGTEPEYLQKLHASKQRKQPDLNFTTRRVDTSGYLSGLDDPRLDGEIADAFDLVERLAKSERVRQSFVRHAFRYWMGRNETLNDSPTLMAVDRAYVESDGSFKELLVSLLTSDSFLMRKASE